MRWMLAAVVAAGEPDDLRQYLGSSFSGMFIFFEYESSATFSHNETVTVDIEWPGSCLVILIIG